VLLKVDTPKGKRLYDKRDTMGRTQGKLNNNKLTRINNKNNNDKKNFNNFKPIRYLIKKYVQETSKNHRD
jgi:hypothetical protein